MMQRFLGIRTTFALPARTGALVCSTHQHVSSAIRATGTSTTTAASTPPRKVKVTFVPATGEKVVVNAHVGAMLMEAARDNDIDIEAACDGTCSCSTCHMYLDAASYAKVPAPSDDELDMLDLAPEVKEGSSRLSCQVRITPELDGMVASIPAAFSNQLS